MAKDTQSQQPDDIDPKLTRLVSNPEKASPLKLWRAIPEVDRVAAVTATLDDGSQTERRQIVRWVAKKLHFRPQTIEGWPRERIAETARRLPLRDRGLAIAMLRSLHLRERRSLLLDYLDGVGIPHDDGLVDLTREFEPADPSRVHASAEALLERHPTGHVLTYALFLTFEDPRLAAGLPAWLRRFQDGEPEANDTSTTARDHAVLRDDEGEFDDAVVGGPEDTDEFTTLDRQLVYTIIDVAQGIEGALSPDQLDDLIDELLALNRSRHRTYFHAGLRDAVLDRGPEDALPAQNANRVRWYWAGFIQGLAREARGSEIVSRYDDRAEVRSLGDTGTGASDAAAIHVFRALCRAGRSGEAAGFLQAEAIARSPSLFMSVHEEGSQLLREDNAAEARALFDLLGQVVEGLERQGVDTSTGTFLEVRRRRAHCYRQLGDARLASDLLDRLLVEERDTDIRSMVLADLGLIDGGFRRLSDLELPREEEQLAQFRAALEEGEARFREAVGIDAKYSAHGHFALGVHALACEDYESATDHLDLALSVFESQPDRYGRVTLLASARLYLGLALCLALRTKRMDRAAALIRSALAEGAAIPPYLVAHTLSALSLLRDDLARETAEAILTASGPELLDVLVESNTVPDSHTIASALLKRASDPTRGESARAEDYRNVLPSLLHQQRYEEAAATLDELEGLAARGVARDEFVELLEDPKRYEPAWTSEDSVSTRIRCLEASGHYDEAMLLLEREFHRVLSTDGIDAVDEAREILDHIHGYGLPRDRTTHLATRLAAKERESTADASDERKRDPLPVSVLFVGGDERQKQRAAVLEADLDKSHPHISVTFLHPGWSGNWSKALEDASQLLPKHDAVVIMRFIRTEFGKQLRKRITAPWRGCHGAGIQAMKASIVRAANAAQAEWDAAAR